jgi:outer membrane receptor protein involved in Fe transport
LAGAAGAQTDPTPASSAVGEVVITGSRIPQPNLSSNAPLVSVDAREVRTGTVIRIEDRVGEMPQILADQSSNLNAGAAGTATLNLHSLGSGRTLVLIDGRRLAPSDPTFNATAPDISLIPRELVDRIDIVTGGASAAYGADAVAGVVNFVMKRDFTGVRLDATAGGFEHANDDIGIDGLLAAHHFARPSPVVLDGFTGDLDGVAGLDLQDGRGNLTLYGGYRHTDPVTQAERDFSACALTAAGGALACTGSTRATALGRFTVYDPATRQPISALTLDPNGPGDTVRAFDGGRDAFDVAPYQFFQRADDRYTAGAFAHGRVGQVELYADAMFMRDRTVEQLAPSAYAPSRPIPIACDNPMLSPSEVEAFCAAAGVGPGGDALVQIGRRDAEAGARDFVITHTDWRALLGARGDLGGWAYDVSLLSSGVVLGQADLNDISLARAAAALNVVAGPNGRLVCASGMAGCVPYDIFQVGGVTPAALNFIRAQGAATNTADEEVASANASRDLSQLRAPWASAPLAVAVGAEFRRDGATYASGGALAGSAPSATLAGSVDVYDLYGELRAPLAQDRPWIQDLSLDMAARYSWFSQGGGAATYKAGGDWAPNADVRFRANYNHSVRQPTVVELLAPQTLARATFPTDPCAGADPLLADPLATRANCARTGVTAAEYGQIAPSPGSYNSLTGGDEHLRLERSDSVTAGFVATPAAVPGLSVSVDYYAITIADVINAIDPQVTLDACLQTGAPFDCDLVHRAPRSGSLWQGPAGYVSAVLVNGGALSTQGVDIQAAWRRALPRDGDLALGYLTAQFAGTYVADLVSRVAPETAAYDCAGSYGLACGAPVPSWRHRLRFAWDTPWPVRVSFVWRYVAPVDVSAIALGALQAPAVPLADRTLGARSYFDLAVEWRVNRRVDLRAGVRNLLDTDPPLIAGGLQTGGGFNGNTFPGLYDVLGRWMFIGVSARL